MHSVAKIHLTAWMPGLVAAIPAAMFGLVYYGARSQWHLRYLLLDTLMALVLTVVAVVWIWRDYRRAAI